MHLLSIFNQFKPAKVMFIGDLMLDVYTLGKVKRISPEAPVSVLNVEREEKLPGGAGNAILNAIALGLQVVAVGRVGNDAAGHYLLQHLASENVDTKGIFVDSNFQTPLKNRVIAENQQMVRIDYENPTPLSKELENQIVNFLPSLMEDLEWIAISDYAKGFITPSFFAAIQDIAHKNGIKIIVDPKGRDFTKYKGAYLIKPNLSEAIAAASADSQTPLTTIAAKIFEDTGIQQLVVTRSRDGISLFSQDAPQQDFPVVIKEVKDVTGAGDTVLAVLLAALANQLDIEKAIRLANIAAGIAVEKLGCARISLAELVHRVLEIEEMNKIFGEDHLYVLQKVLNKQSFIVLAISGHLGMTTALFKAIHQLSQKKCPLVIYIQDSIDDDFLSLLASLKEISFIILKKENLYHFCEQIPPENLFWMEDKTLHCFQETQEFLDFQSIL